MSLLPHDPDLPASAEPLGKPACSPGPDEITRLHVALDLVREQTNPRTARLLRAGVRHMAKTLIEEAGEVALEASRHNARATARGSADLLYLLVVLWRECGIAPDEVWAEMRRRADRFGLAEKPPKSAALFEPGPRARQDLP
ncbi:phosphoribosyl-ATP diphosphatase [Methylobacterium sp. JK268]